MVLSMLYILPMRLRCINIKTAYRQSDPITLESFLQPPAELNVKRNYLWKLNKLLYGVTEAGRQWAKELKVECWKSAYRKSEGVSQLYFKRAGDGSVRMCIKKALIICSWTEVYNSWRNSLLTSLKDLKYIRQFLVKELLSMDVILFWVYMVTLAYVWTDYYQGLNTSLWARWVGIFAMTRIQIETFPSIVRGPVSWRG